MTGHSATDGGSLTMDQATTLFLDGYSSGVASAIRNFSDVDAEYAYRIARNATDAICGDPLAMEALRSMFAQRLAGHTPAPFGMTVFGVHESGSTAGE